MSAPPNAAEIAVYQTNRFEKALHKLPEAQRHLVEDEIDAIIDTPCLGELKKGDLAHLRVHKFSLNRQQVLLGYSWLEGKLELYLLQLGPHENFYDKAKEQRKSDLERMT